MYIQSEKDLQWVPTSEAYFGLCQTSMMKLFAKTIDV